MPRRLLSLLDRYILKEVSGSFLFGVMAFTVILVAGDLLFDIADLLIERGVSLGVVMKLFVYKLPAVVVLTLPMSCLLGTLLSFGRLSANSEIVALKASGISFRKIVRPILLASFFVGGAALLLNETIVPLSNEAAENLIRYDVVRQKPSLMKERVFLKDESGGRLNRVIYVSKLKPRSGQMDDIIVQEFEVGKLRRITVAQRGLWRDGEWWIENGQVFDVSSDSRVTLLLRFQRQKLTLNLSPAQVERASRKPEEMSAAELLAHIKLMETQGANLLPLWMMFHLRLAIPWSSMVLALIGATLGVRPQRRGSSMGFGISIIIVFAYYVVMSMSRALGQTGYIAPVIAAWLPNVCFLIFGGLLARRANG